MLSDQKERGATMEENNEPQGENRKGPTWRAWVLSVIVAIALSVMATLLLGGNASFRPEGAAPAGGAGSEHKSGDVCCPPAAK
jgi:hypothetical protein